MIWNQQRKVRVAPRALQEFLSRVERELHVGEKEVTVCLVSDAKIARMNEEFRGKKGATDVLSFPSREAERKKLNARIREDAEAAETRESSGKSRGADAYLGDIAIAPGVARRYAKKNGRTLDSELRVLILHGVLHLLGYDHEADRGAMDRIEQKMRRRFGLA